VAARDARNHGVWVGSRKLGSVGIAIRRGITFHGLALNVDIDLIPFSWVNPCGLSGVTMTSLSRELGRPVTMATVGSAIPEVLGEVFARPVTPFAKEQLYELLHP
jgi:lipoyl(octanoyl) transferase